MNVILGCSLILIGFVPFWFARQAIRTGEVRIGDQVSKTTYRREEDLAAYWFGVSFYVLLGVGLLVLGALAVAGILE